MRRIKCEVCRKRFTPKLYTAIEEQAPLTRITLAPKKYDACDCPYCNHQIILGVRYDRLEATVIPEVIKDEVYDKIKEDGINEQNL